MKAIVLHRFGEADQLKMEEVQTPVAGDSQVLLKVKAIGINPVDAKVRAGTNRMAKGLQLPAVIGWDVSGEIVHCGKAVKLFKEGDAVFGVIGFPGAGGAYAAYALAEEASLALKPPQVSFEEAAALPIAGLTAYQAIHEHLKVESGQQVLIQAAAGGVGHFSVQLAKQAGAQVSGTASAKNKDFLYSLGIDQVIDYQAEKFEEKVKEVDAVQEAMGGAVLYRSIHCTRKGGRVICLPSSTKNDPKAIALAEAKGITLEWPMMHASQAQLEVLGDLVNTGKLKVHLNHVFDFTEIARAHRAIETHATNGKIVVRA